MPTENAHVVASTGLPSLSALGRDLLTVTSWQITVSLARPAISFLLFWLCAAMGHPILAAFFVAAFLFFTYTSTSHDLVHRTLRLAEPLNEWLLAVLEALALRSGHAFRVTHLQHHKCFPHEDDVEGFEPAQGFWHALRCGPTHQVRLFVWAWKNGNGSDRRWMSVEALCVLAIWIATVAFWQQAPFLRLYVLLVTMGSWLYPLATVWWPHSAAGKSALEQTRGFRGRIIPFLFFGHTYHLEHHLYPGICSHQWPELGRRLEQHLERAGVKFVRLP